MAVNLSWNLKAAIIGYWRNGATLWQIHEITGIAPEVIELKIKKYVKDYKSSLK